MQNFVQYFRALQVLFFALLAGQIIMATVLWFAVSPSSAPTTEFAALDYIFIGLCALGAANSFFLGKKLTEIAREKPDLPSKLAAYRTARILRYALLEGPVLVCLVGFFFVTVNYFLLAAAAAGIVLFATQVPRRDVLVSELDLTMAEQAKLDDSDEMVAEAPKK